jgi:deferrochelatase/peroxidase EfeB
LNIPNNTGEKTTDEAQEFVGKLLPLITRSIGWVNPQGAEESRLTATTNIAFTYKGLQRLGVPVLALQSFPDEFIIGMRNRRSILGNEKIDTGKGNELKRDEDWESVWKEEIHIFVSIEARNQIALEARFTEIEKLYTHYSSIELLDGHMGGNPNYPNVEAAYQEASVLYRDKNETFPIEKEHFGYTDGISNPFFDGMTEGMGELIGGGKKRNYGNPMEESTWEPLETGEFILGYRDEAQEYPDAPTPPLLAKNGSFLVYSKFHENVGAFNEFLDNLGAIFPGGKEALAAKFVGRWRNGAPITSFPTEIAANKIAEKRELAFLRIYESKTPEERKSAQANYKEINKAFLGFDYADDLDGSKCPMGAHIRRTNARGALNFGDNKAFNTPSALDNRRRMIRRGLPYGKAETTDSTYGNHGTIIMTICASIKRQFEFVVQQWINYGNDFKLGNDKDPMLGNHGPEGGRMIVEGSKDIAPYFISKIPQFIEPRGGEYFFIPSITALRMITTGRVDPT